MCSVRDALQNIWKITVVTRQPMLLLSGVQIFQPVPISVSIAHHRLMCLGRRPVLQLIGYEYFISYFKSASIMAPIPPPPKSRVTPWYVWPDPSSM